MFTPLLLRNQRYFLQLIYKNISSPLFFQEQPKGDTGKEAERKKRMIQQISPRQAPHKRQATARPGAAGGRDTHTAPRRLA